MDRRLIGCGGMALVLHAALAGLAAFQPAGAAPSGVSAAATDIELLERLEPALPPEPESPPEPEPERAPPEPPSTSAEPAPARVAARVASRAPAVARVVTSPDADRAAGSAPELVPDTKPEPAPSVAEPAPARRLSLAELGLSASSPAILPPQPDAPSRVPPDVADVGGLKAALAARDVALGIGPGGAVANQLRTLAHDLVPLGSQATISVDLARDGSLEALWLEDVTSSEHDWRKVLHAVRLRLGKRSIISSGGPVRVTLLLTSRSSKRSGPSTGGLDFDVSNIGSPTLHTLHVRVLGQSPL